MSKTDDELYQEYIKKEYKAQDLMKFLDIPTVTEEQISDWMFNGLQYVKCKNYRSC